jgi:hypothetical protein
MGLSFVVQDVAQAEVLAEPGQSALFTVSVSVEGSVNAPQGRKDEVIRWATQRLFEASVRMEAEKAEQVSFNSMAGNGVEGLPPVYADLAKQIEACGEDQACAMSIAMQMATSPEFKEATNSAPRYQVWKAAREDTLVDVKASYEDKWYTLFYVSGPEITDCTVIAPLVSPELTRTDPNAQATWDKINQETLQASAEAFVIETDAENGTSQLQLIAIGAGSADEKCTETIGGNAETHHRSTNGSVFPVGELQIPLLLNGAAPGTNVIASGSEVIDTKLPLNHLAGGFKVDVSVPLKVKVRWELKRL